MPINSLRLGMAAFDGSTPRWLDLPLGSTFSSLQALMASGTSVATSVGHTAWKAMVGPSASMQQNCNAEGINPITSGGGLVRIGLFGNQENDCSSPDSMEDSGCISFH